MLQWPAIVFPDLTCRRFPGLASQQTPGSFFARPQGGRFTSTQPFYYFSSMKACFLSRLHLREVSSEPVFSCQGDEPWRGEWKQSVRCTVQKTVWFSSRRALTVPVFLVSPCSVISAKVGFLVEEDVSLSLLSAGIRYSANVRLLHSADNSQLRWCEEWL